MRGQDAISLLNALLVVVIYQTHTYYSGAPSSRFDIALEYDVNTDDTDDDHDSDDTEKMTNKRVDESEAEDEVIS